MTSIAKRNGGRGGVGGDGGVVVSFYNHLLLKPTALGQHPVRYNSSVSLQEVSNSRPIENPDWNRVLCFLISSGSMIYTIPNVIFEAHTIGSDFAEIWVWELKPLGFKKGS